MARKKFLGLPSWVWGLGAAGFVYWCVKNQPKYKGTAGLGATPALDCSDRYRCYQECNGGYSACIFGCMGDGKCIRECEASRHICLASCPPCVGGRLPAH